VSLLSSLYTGTTGLEVNSQDLSVIGDNIANASTIGFKAGRADFEDQLSQNLLGTGQIGMGAEMQRVQQILTQGSLTTTGVVTDLALQGPGYFVVTGNHNGQVGSFFTRDGRFSMDRSGFLVNQDGLRVQGFIANAGGIAGATMTDLNLGASSQPFATTTVTVKANLQSDAVIPAAWDPANPDKTSNFAAGVTVYDSLGAAHTASLYYRRTGAGTWEWHALADGGGLVGGTKGTAVEIANGTLSFDASGKLTDQTSTSNFNPLGAVTPQALAFNFGDPTSTGGTGLAGTTQFSAASSASFVDQDGYAAGQLSGVTISTDGNITGNFTNGQTRVLGTIGVASFSAPDRLSRVGGNLLVTTQDSGQPTTGTAGQGGRGTISSGTLEQSNVDMAGEFVRMIAAQRGFSANSKTVNTADQMLQELIQLKR
jgi:flagellar hook protein FlgE